MEERYWLPIGIGSEAKCKGLFYRCNANLAAIPARLQASQGVGCDPGAFPCKTSTTSPCSPK